MRLGLGASISGVGSSLNNAPWVLKWLQVVAVILWTTAASADVPESLHFEDKTAEFGLENYVGPTWTPGWLDFDMDGRAEPFFLSHDTIFYLDYNAAEGVTLHEVTVLGGETFAASAGDQTAMASGDFDRDGRVDLVTFKGFLRVFTLVAPGVLELQDVVANPLPPSTHVVDAATADFNLDGWPDIALAMGRFGNDHMYPLGPVDLIYMNRGGHFERVEVLPSVRAQSNAITAADVDRDGRVDLIESLDFSQVAGLSRVLLNKTPAGSSYPVFVAEKLPFDVGTFGMGTAVADLNGDGLVDIYTASTGRDLLALRLPEGGYSDAGLAWGIDHELGQDGARIQWAPTFSDINGDGVLDLFVRHSNLVTNGFEEVSEIPHTHLLYLGDESGRMVRAGVPFDPSSAFNGINATLGDLDGDGLPDVAFGGVVQGAATTSLPGRPEFWLNTSPSPGSRRHLTLRFAPSVSANPPTGAWVEAQCGGVPQSRLLASGGKVGALAPDELAFAWAQDCGDVTASVRWPSGITVHYDVAAETNHVVVSEPEWFNVDASDSDGPKVRLSGVAACFQDAGGSDPACCSQDDDCAFSLLPGPASPGVVYIEGQAPMTLAPSIGFHTLLTLPSLPAPGEPFAVRAGQGGGWGEASPPWGRVDGVKVPWELGPSPTGVWQTTHTAASGASAVDLGLFVETTKVYEAKVPLFLVVDPRVDDTELWPYQDPSNPLKLWRFSFAPGHHNLVLKKSLLTVRRADGAVVEKVKRYVTGHGRVTIEVPWDQLPVSEELFIYEEERVVFGPLPAFRAPAQGGLDAKASAVRGFNVRPVLAAGGSPTVLVYTVLDGSGYALPPSLVDVEVDLGDLLELVEASEPLAPYWEKMGRYRSTGKVGTGDVVFRVASSGKVLGKWEVRVREPAVMAVDLEQSALFLSYHSLPAGVGASAELTIHAVNYFGEMLGADVPLQIDAAPGIFLSPVHIGDAGTRSLTVEPGFYGGTYAITVGTPQGPIGTVTLEVVGPEAPGTPHEAQVLADDLGLTHQGDAPIAPDPGCGTSQAPLSLAWIVALMALWALRVVPRSGRRRRYGGE